MKFEILQLSHFQYGFLNVFVKTM